MEGWVLTPTHSQLELSADCRRPFEWSHLVGSQSSYGDDSYLCKVNPFSGFSCSYKMPQGISPGIHSRLTLCFLTIGHHKCWWPFHVILGIQTLFESTASTVGSHVHRQKGPGRAIWRHAKVSGMDHSRSIAGDSFSGIPRHCLDV